MATIKGTSGDDNLVGTSSADTFNVTQGGNDTVSGGDGDDTINFGASFTAADTVNGGTGSDQVVLDGDYSHGVTFTASTMVGVEKIVLRAGDSYRLTTVDQTVAAGGLLVVNGSALGKGDGLTFNGGAETDGTFHFIGGAGDDRLVGSTGADSFDLTRGGTDSVQGGQGDDVINLGTSLTATDQIRGGAGNDTAELSTGGSITFNATTMLGVENVLISGKTATALAINAATITPGTTMTFDASADKAKLNLDVSAKLAGEDVHVTGSIVGDLFSFGGAFSAGDTVTGGGGSDTLSLSGDYSAGLTITNPLVAIHTLTLGGGFTYDLDLGTSPLALIDGSAAGQMTIDASLVTGLTKVIGSAGGDVITVSSTSVDVNGEGGDDTIIEAAGTGNGDAIIRGNDGYDTLVLYKDIDQSQMYDLEQIDVMPGSGGFGIFLDGTLSRQGNAIHEVDGHLLGANEPLNVIGNNFREVGFAYGGAGNDHLEASTAEGGGGADFITLSANYFGGGEYEPTGKDTVIYAAASDSTSAQYDTVDLFETGEDTMKLWFTVTGVDATVNSDSLQVAASDFDSSLAAVVGPSQLEAHHAVLVNDRGYYPFLVIDANGVAGYQAGQDLVIALDELGGSTFTTANFTT